MIAEMTVEQRVAALEEEVAALRAELAASRSKKHWLDSIVGCMADIPKEEVEQMVEYGRQFRASQTFETENKE